MRISLQFIYFFITLGLGSPIPDPDTINIIFNCVSSNCNQVNGHPGTHVGGVTHPKGSSETEKFRSPIGKIPNDSCPQHLIQA